MNDRFTINLLRRGVTAGTLEITFPDGSTDQLVGADFGPTTRVRIVEPGALGRVLFAGSNALVEAYMNHQLEPDDLTSFLHFAATNQQRWAQRHPRLYGMGRSLGARLPTGNHEVAVDTMADHYNLGNDFYEAWLDPTMTYSAARFEESDRTLEQAQRAKYARLAELCDLQPGHKVLEIGTGWGGMARYAAELGCHVTTLTIAKEQADYAERMNRSAGLEDKIDVRLLDYAEIEGTYDRVVSIEMIESIDDSRWPDYFATIARVLKPGGRAGLQAILIADDFYDSYRTNEDFIRRYIFPGGLLPSPNLLQNLAQSNSLSWDTDERFGLDYAKTLAVWHDRFEAAWDRIGPMGFDERFRRMWKTYLSYCEAGFRTGRIDVTQFTLTRPLLEHTV